jgi:hypothetical protein
MADITKKYTQEDFGEMAFRAGVLKDFVETLTYVDNHAPPLASVALIIMELIDPISDFLLWADTYAEIPNEEEPA